MKGSDFIFDYVYSLSYKCYKINSNYVRSYIDSEKIYRSYKPKINPINKSDYKNFQYATICALSQINIIGKE